MHIRTVHEVLTNVFPNQPLTTVEQGSAQVAVHEIGRMPRRPKVHDHQLAPCNLYFLKQLELRSNEMDSTSLNASLDLHIKMEQ